LATGLASPAPQSKSKIGWPAALVAVAVAGLGAIVVWGLFAGERPADSDAIVDALSTTPDSPLKANLEASVLNPDGEGWLIRGPMTPKNLPLRIGDQLRFTVTSSEPRFMYVYWIDYDGGVERKWPPEGADLSRQTPSKALMNPARASDGVMQGWPLTSRSGPEAVFVGMSERMLNESDLNEVKKVLQDLPRELSPGKVLAHFEYPTDEQPTPAEDERSESIERGAGAAQRLEGKITVEDRPLRQWFDAYRGWVFETKD
jgi:hypothetical protein